jgi:hypothetical protein
VTATVDELDAITRKLTADHGERVIDLTRMLERATWNAPQCERQHLQQTLTTVTRTYMAVYDITPEQVLAANEAVRQARVTVAVLNAIPNDHTVALFQHIDAASGRSEPVPGANLIRAGVSI